MKLWTLVGMIAGFFLIKFATKKSTPVVYPATPVHHSEFDARYDIYDFITD